VLDYVAAHEVAHLAQMNHSPAFWAVVTRLCPGWQARARWLRAEGHRLHGAAVRGLSAMGQRPAPDPTP
jgi:predicted metal-dependent hydrolase